MIRAVLGGAYHYRDFDVVAGNLPEPEASDAFIITGSSAGVYDKLEWIARLLGWLRDLNAKTPVVGICFGHQVMAQAYGGSVEKTARGWTAGIHEYEVKDRESWMDGPQRFSLPFAHQDQVTLLPAAVRVIAGSEFCPYGALSYRERNAISFQGHPEFTPAFIEMLVDRREQSGRLSADEAARAKASLVKPHDCARIATWIRRFIETSSEA
jgi:GMP synthase-like glutamine amidotransferase